MEGSCNATKTISYGASSRCNDLHSKDKCETNRIPQDIQGNVPDDQEYWKEAEEELEEKRELERRSKNLQGNQVVSLASAIWESKVFQDVIHRKVTFQQLVHAVSFDDSDRRRQREQYLEKYENFQGRSFRAMKLHLNN